MQPNVLVIVNMRMMMNECLEDVVLSCSVHWTSGEVFQSVCGLVGFLSIDKICAKILEDL